MRETGTRKEFWKHVRWIMIDGGPFQESYHALMSNIILNVFFFPLFFSQNFDIDIFFLCNKKCMIKYK